MNCHEFEENLPLLLYGELSDAELAACQEHLVTCAHCRAEREKLERLHQVLAQTENAKASAGLLAEARMGLDEALDKEPQGWRALWSRGLPMLRFQPASGFALAMTLILCGFGVGWGLRPHADRLTSATPEVSTSDVGGEDLDNMHIRGISRVDPDPHTGGVKITMDAEKRVTLEGSMDDPKIQQVLLYAVKSYDNPGIRRDTLDALRNHTDNPNVREALIYTLQHDANAGVRLEALDAVSGLKSSSDVHAALLNALEHDANPGVRVAAVDALIDSTETESSDQATTQALAHLATSDSNPYIRLRCASAVMRAER